MKSVPLALQCIENLVNSAEFQPSMPDSCAGITHNCSNTSYEVSPYIVFLHDPSRKFLYYKHFLFFKPSFLPCYLLTPSTPLLQSIIVVLDILSVLN